MDRKNSMGGPEVEEHLDRNFSNVETP
jgi:hypothetical protein